MEYSQLNYALRTARRERRILKTELETELENARENYRIKPSIFGWNAMLSIASQINELS